LSVKQRQDQSNNSNAGALSTERPHPVDIAIYVLCIVGILVSLNFFRLDLFRTLTRQSEPIGTITFKYKAAQRRFQDRVLWDRLKTESPVYDGDIIRTADLSEAKIAFVNGSIVDLAENTLIQVHGDDQGARVDINDGGVNASSGDSALVLVSGGRQVTMETGAALNASMDGEGLTLRVMEGAVSFAGSGETGSVTAGAALALGAGGPLSLREATALFPLPKARFISPKPGKFSVPFRWNRANLPLETITRLEIAEDRAFSRVAYREDLVVGAAAVELEPGSYFWRVSLADEADPAPAILSFKILLVPAPILIAPVEGYRYQFRAKRPSVRFHWTETNEALSYILEVADNPAMENLALSQEVRGTSFYFPGLEPGIWHWRVRPVFPASYEGVPGEGVPASFSIVQTGELRAPELQLPPDRGTVRVGANREDVYFSWRAGTEARSYKVLISANRDLSNPLVDATAQDNFYVCRVGVLAPGQYYWSVFQTDVEGNDSAFSPPRSFVALEGDDGPVQTLVFPPDGYTVESSRLPDTRFTWKTTLPFQTRFQVSGSPGFSSLAIDEAVGGGSFQGRVLPGGTWYWRIQAKGPSDTVFETPPRSFTATAPITAPLLLEPAADGLAIIQEGKPLVFSWTAPAGAEYYQFKVYFEGDRTNPVYEDDAVAGTRQSLAMEGRPMGKYRWTAQGFARETAWTARRTGLISEGVFTARKLLPVSLDYPRDSISFDGLQAYREPETLRWSSTEQVGTSRFILSTRSDFSGQPVAVINNPPQRIALPRLQAGDYYWTIQAETPGGLDISAKEPRRFRVLPIPPLVAPRLLEPASGAQVIIQEKEPQVFSWTASAGAEYYQFRLYQGEDRTRPVYENGLVAGTRQSLAMNSYPVGNYRWTVQGFARESSRTARRTGLVSEGVFSARRPFPVSLDYPGDGADLDGRRAYLQQETLQWSSSDQVGTSRFILSTSSDFSGQPLAVIDNPPQRIVPPRLLEGDYYWTIQAETLGGSDISARESRRFRVLPIPLLPQAPNRLPEDGTVIGGAELRANRRIVFSWDAVPGATGYFFALDNADTGETVMRQGPLAETTLSLDDLTILDVGTFVWRLEAVLAEPAKGGRGFSGTIIRRGAIGENRFVIDFNLPDVPEPQEPGILYGREG
jgi:hypothetical protein